MHKVVIENMMPTAGIDIKNQLINSGLEINRDFVWRYQSAQYNSDGYQEVAPRQVVFEFTNPADATFFKLKWT
jgi:hypothetical protein